MRSYLRAVTRLNKHNILKRSFCSQSLPIIDINKFISCPIKNRNYKNHQNLIEELIDVGSKSGFFYLTGFNDIIPSSLINSTLSELKLFFDLPNREKMKCHRSINDPFIFGGYVQMGDYGQGNYGVDEADKRINLQNNGHYNNGHGNHDELDIDRKEVFIMGSSLNQNDPNYNQYLFGNNSFPSSNILPSFENTMNSYYRSVSNLSNHLFQLFAIALDQRCDYFDNKINVGINSMHCNYYLKGKDGNNKQLGIAEHTDYECFTLLLQDPNGPTGLEVLCDDGKWNRYKPIENTFVVNFGDMMARFSNDMFKSTVHRVVTNEDAARYSIAFFRGCNFNVNVQNLMQNESAKYEPILFGQHMINRQVAHYVKQ